MTNEPKIRNDYQLAEALSRISVDQRSPLDFKWRFEFKPFLIVHGEHERSRSGWLLWAEFDRIDVDTGKKGIGRGRDEIIWSGATISAVAKTAWVIFEMLVKHEMMHAFQFDGRPLFDPHATVDRLHSISDQDKVADTYGINSTPP